MHPHDIAGLLQAVRGVRSVDIRAIPGWQSYEWHQCSQNLNALAAIRNNLLAHPHPSLMNKHANNQLLFQIHLSMEVRPVGHPSQS